MSKGKAGPRGAPAIVAEILRSSFAMRSFGIMVAASETAGGAGAGA